jgi:hypothetical protein
MVISANVQVHVRRVFSRMVFVERLINRLNRALLSALVILF